MPTSAAVAAASDSSFDVFTLWWILLWTAGVVYVLTRKRDRARRGSKSDGSGGTGTGGDAGGGDAGGGDGGGGGGGGD